MRFARAEISAVAKRMRELDVGAIPVATNGALVGMVTDRDITIRCAADHQTISCQGQGRDDLRRRYCRNNEDIEDAVHHEGKADPQAAGARRGDADGR
jgi:hypothetical protein